MKIQIKYNGSMAECFIEDTFGEEPFKVVPFAEADKMSQVFALGAFSCIKEWWQREQRKLASDIKEEKRNGKS